MGGKMGFLKYFFCCAAALIFSSCSEMCLQGEGNLVDEFRDLEVFHAIHIDCDAEVTFHKAEDGKSRLEMLIQKNLVPNFKSVVKEGTLVLTHEKCVGKHTPITIKIFLGGEIDELRLDGSGEVTSEGIFPSSNLRLAVSGTSKCILDFQGNVLDILHSGALDLMVKGSCNELKAVLGGTGNLELLGVQSNVASVNLNGTGDVKLSVSEALAVDLSGTGKVRYRGTPRIEKQNITGTGDIRQLSGY